MTRHWVMLRGRVPLPKFGLPDVTFEKVDGRQRAGHTHEETRPMWMGHSLHVCSEPWPEYNA